MKLYQAINQTIIAIENCKKTKNQEWLDRWEKRLDELERLLPSGSGLDGKVSIDRDRTGRNSIVIYCEFHHMNDCGEYEGWSEHTLRLVPDFVSGITVKSITGFNLNDIKDYLADTFIDSLTTTEVDLT